MSEVYRAGNGEDGATGGVEFDGACNLEALNSLVPESGLAEVVPIRLAADREELEERIARLLSLLEGADPRHGWEGVLPPMIDPER